MLSFFLPATIDDMVSIEVNRDGPFYLGTSLNISCVWTIPETVDPDIIRDVRIAKAGSSYSTYSTHFNSLEYSNEGNYYCRVCFSRRDYYYYRGNCESTTEQFFLDGELKTLNLIYSPAILLSFPQLRKYLLLK